MIDRWSRLTPQERLVLETTFTALTTIDARRAGAVDPAERVAFSRLVDHVLGRVALSDAEWDGVNRDPRRLAELDTLLGKYALARSPRLAAASSGALDEREGDGFRLSLRATRADPRQVYVHLSVTEGREMPRQLVVIAADGRALHHTLPAATDREFQFLVDRGGPLHAALVAADSALYLL